MKLLVSPTSVAEARVAVLSAVDVIDIKNPAEGSLGCPHPAVAREIARLARQSGREVSIAIGDLYHQPGTAAMAALGAMQFEVKYIKAGLRASRTTAQAATLLQWMVESVEMAATDHSTPANPCVVACGYADYRSMDGLAPADLIAAATIARCDFAMLDTFAKDGQSLFDLLSLSELQEFVFAARSRGLGVALAGSLSLDHLPRLIELQPDIIGVRGAICENQDRESRICPEQTRIFVDAAAALGS